jgi:hypothetical protein
MMDQQPGPLRSAQHTRRIVGRLGQTLLPARTPARVVHVLHYCRPSPWALQVHEYGCVGFLWVYQVYLWNCGFIRWIYGFMLYGSMDLWVYR